MASYIEGALIKDETVIAQGNKKILLVILSAFFLIVPFGVWMFTLDAEFILTFGRHNSPYSSPIFVHAFGVVLAALGCLVGLNGIRRLYGDKRGLVFNSAGLDDYTSKVGFIPWHEIEGAKVVDRGGQRLLAIKLKDPTRFLARQSWYRRVLFKLNIRFYGTPAIFSLNPLEASPQEVLGCFDQYLQKYGDGA